MRDRWRVGEGKARCRGLSETEKAGHEWILASLEVAKTKIPWVLMMFIRLIFSIVSRVIWANPDTRWISDSPQIANMRFAGGYHSSDAFHTLESTGEGFGDGPSLHVSCVPGELEEIPEDHLLGLDFTPEDRDETNYHETGVLCRGS